MTVQNINVSTSIVWVSVKNKFNSLYKFGDEKDSTIDGNWSKTNVIYRWYGILRERLPILVKPRGICRKESTTTLLQSFPVGQDRPTRKSIVNNRG